MFAVMVRPLGDFFTEDAEDEAMAGELLKMIQGSLSEEVGETIHWDEEPSSNEEYLADELDSHCLWGLRVAAAYLEQRGTLAGCDPGSEPWEHEVILTLEKQEKSERFQQLLHAEADLLCYAPVELPDVFQLTMGSDEDEDEAEEDSEDVIAIGSLPALSKELDELHVALGLPDEIPDSEELVFDAEEDPLAAAKCGCVVLRERAKEAMETQTPLILVWDDVSDVDEEGAPG